MPISLPPAISGEDLGHGDEHQGRAGLQGLRDAPPEKENTAGMIISPARIAISVSKISTWIVESSMLVSFFM